MGSGKFLTYLDISRFSGTENIGMETGYNRQSVRMGAYIVNTPKRVFRNSSIDLSLLLVVAMDKSELRKRFAWQF